ncbi:3-phosphoshikimate 1-carboxyvinyltransferase, chloroplastic [Porphyridium purpureum]|uniref:3-phosphoshikimate 1-carboxyvinyltransferase n=1 Tax=Porphyridium purpureum TaxID=35688 RepID=A0A5J4Z8J0_PORPP|nr:3-phosphoshikimate 1-carboxyvinyltransferase, chloroplastic [Porphyridium purpureum]|eukprot:POR6016..scf295_1
MRRIAIGSDGSLINQAVFICCSKSEMTQSKVQLYTTVHRYVHLCTVVDVGDVRARLETRSGWERADGGGRRGAERTMMAFALCGGAAACPAVRQGERRGLCGRPAPGTYAGGCNAAPARAAWRTASPVAMSAAAGLESLRLEPIGKISGEIDLPGSKSLSNRMLLLAALARGTTVVENLLDSDDVQYMLAALKELGVECSVDWAAKKAVVKGCAGAWPAAGAELFLGNAGTAMRPLAAAVCAGHGTFVLDGTPRMRERPIKDLVDALQQLGAKVTCSDTGCPPVRVEANGLPGGVARVSGKISSQYLSALLMVAPLAKSEVTLEIKDELVSVPYVLMTVNLMKRFGVHVEVNDEKTSFTIPAGQSYQSPGTVFVEGDASSASYFSAGGAITGGPMKVLGCGSESIQGDIDFTRVLEKMGAKVEWSANSITVSRDAGVKLRGVDVDCGDIPDAAMTLAVVALFADGKTAIRNVYNWRVKETERMKAIVTELRKLGAHVEEGHDYCIIDPPARINPDVAIDTYDDHRMAMCFSLAACAGVPVVINDPKCTKKTFPTYFDELARVSS